MSKNPGWKQFERFCATLIGGTRFWANSGEAIDVESPHFSGQCKNVARLSLSELTDLVAKTDEQAKERGRHGITFVREKRAQTTLVILSHKTWQELQKERILDFTPAREEI